MHSAAPEPRPAEHRRAGRPSKARSRRFAAAVVAVPLLLILLGLVLTERAPKFHPYVAFQASDAIQVNLLQQPHRDKAQCQAAVERMVQAMRTVCSICRVVESRCLDTLDSRQRKIISRRPVDVPVIHTPNASVAFMSSTPEFSLQACLETERQAAGSLPGDSQCVSPGAESLALSVAAIGGRTDATVQQPGALIGVTLLPAAISFILCFVIVRFERAHGRFTHDLTATGPQKFHAVPTTRIGGLAVAFAVAGAVLVARALNWLSPAPADGLALLTLAAIPAFAGGFGEDVTKRVGVLARLMLTISAGVIASLLVGATLDRLDIPGLDALLQWSLFAIAFTAFAVGGIANAMNIIDGYNGLVGGFGVLVLAALAWVAGRVGDSVVLTASLIMLGTLLGFLVWNYPKGKIFLGDGGAYLLGFWLAELSVLLVVRNPDVSPWFPLVLLVYPIFETLFSIYRRTFLRAGNAGRPDALHLHQLIYTRLVRLAVESRNVEEVTRRNSAVAGYAWAASALFILPALFLWRNTPALMACAAVFCAAYLWLYRRRGWSGPSGDSQPRHRQRDGQSGWVPPARLVRTERRGESRPRRPDRVTRGAILLRTSSATWPGADST
jgi:UDP-N-acetylmuramyl pentapeptide phosphotransferase/UDP-N-acetylglucosamine-1-phosphate transferase